MISFYYHNLNICAYCSLCNALFQNIFSSTMFYAGHFDGSLDSVLPYFTRLEFPSGLLLELDTLHFKCLISLWKGYPQAENSLLTPFQSNFIQGDYITFQLLHSNHSFLEAVDSGEEVRVVFCDISKAFDRVWHRGAST